LPGRTRKGGAIPEGSVLPPIHGESTPPLLA